MTEKEIAEIRRRFRPDKSNISHIRGCCVNEKGEIVSDFNQSIGMMQQEESERMLGVLKRTLSGGLQKNLVDIPFTTAQVTDSEEHHLLMKLRDTALEDEETLQAFFQKVISSVVIEGNYLILLAHDSYDVPYRAADGEKLEDASSDVFSYILCSVCPVKTTKPALGYYLYENQFHTSSVDWLVSAPTLGFLFPAFDDRAANIYDALFYTKDPKERHDSFIDTIFKSVPPIPADEQKEMFQDLLSDTLEEECSYEVVQAVHDELRGLIEEHKVNKEEQPLTVSRETVKGVLATTGISDEHIIAFAEKFDETFGQDANLSPQNIVDTKRFQVSTPNVIIRVKPEYSDLLETRVINGSRYILIRITEGVEVNGVPVQIQEPEPELEPELEPETEE